MGPRPVVDAGRLRASTINITYVLRHFSVEMVDETTIAVDLDDRERGK